MVPTMTNSSAADETNEMITAIVNGLTKQGWSGGAADYDVGSFPGDLDLLEEKLGRKPTKEEGFALNDMVRAELDRLARRGDGS